MQFYNLVIHMGFYEQTQKKHAETFDLFRIPGGRRTIPTCVHLST